MNKNQIQKHNVIRVLELLHLNNFTQSPVNNADCHNTGFTIKDSEIDFNFLTKKDYNFRRSNLELCRFTGGMRNSVFALSEYSLSQDIIYEIYYYGKSFDELDLSLFINFLKGSKASLT